MTRRISPVSLSVVVVIAALAPGRARAEEAPPLPAEPLATLRFTSDPAGATVFVDGVDRGAAPVDVPVPPGEHEVAVRQAGWEIRGPVLAEVGRITEVELAALGRAAPTSSSPEPVGEIVAEPASPEPYLRRVPRWPWVEVALMLGVSQRTLAVPINPALDTGGRDEARLETEFYPSAGFTLAVSPFAGLPSRWVRGLGVTATARLPLALEVWNRRQDLRVDTTAYEAGALVFYRVPVCAFTPDLPDALCPDLGLRVGYFHSTFSLGDEGNDIVPPFEYDTVRLGLEGRGPLGIRHLWAEASLDLLPVGAAVGEEATMAYGGSGLEPQSLGVEARVALAGRLGGVDLGVAWVGRWLVTEFEGIGRGWGVEPTTIIGQGGNGIQTMGPAVDATHHLELFDGYRY